MSSRVRQAFVLAGVSILAAALAFGAVGCRPTPASDSPGPPPRPAPVPDSESASGGGTGSGGPGPGTPFLTEEFWTASGNLPPSAPGLRLDEATIPFAVVPFAQPGESRAIGLGFWDLNAGQVTFSDKPLFTIAADEMRLTWDGGPVVGVATANGAIPASTKADLAFVTFDAPGSYLNFFDTIACPPGYRGFVVAARRPSDQMPYLAVQDWTSADRGTPPMIHELAPARPDLEVFRPVDLSVRDGQVEVVLELATAETAYLCRGRLDEASGAIAWDNLTSDLGVTEAGAGTRMARLGNEIWVAEQGSVIKRVNLGSGTAEEDTTLGGLLADFRAQYVKAAEYLAPPTPFGYRGTLILEYIPPDFQNPSAYVLAVKGGAVVGEIVRTGSHLMVRKGGQVTQELDLPEKDIPFWSFPQG